MVGFEVQGFGPGLGGFGRVWCSGFPGCGGKDFGFGGFGV